VPDDVGDALALHDVGLGAERILAAIVELREDVRAIRAALGERERVSLPRVHLRVMTPLAAEISAGVGDLEWTARELFEEAASDSRLRGALVAAIGPLNPGATRRLGRLLARCEGATLPNGYRVERADDDRPADCATWRVVR
jgi:hypothetical protein